MVKIRVDGHSGTITLNRPEKHNALSRQMLRELSQAFFDLHGEKNVRAVILTGAGTSFCSGLDLWEIHHTNHSENPWPQWHEDSAQYRELLLTMLRFPKPIVAAVNGPALASGAGLVLAADLVLGTETARFGFPEVQVGLAAGIITPLLCFRLGGSHAARLLLTGESASAADAKAMGVYQELVAFDLLWARAHEIATRCAGTAHEAVAMTKRMLNETVGEHLERLLTVGAAVTATSRTTEAAVEGVSAFLEKRPPDWK